MTLKSRLYDRDKLRRKFVLSCSIFLLFRGIKCLMPEASQEGSLRSFKSYSDVVTFHYAVPKEVLRATWQFAAFMDGKDCAARKVHIHLQWGSYPVIDAGNASYPPGMNPSRNDAARLSTMTTYDAETSVVLPVDSPEAGDWFVGAYLAHWDERVQQRGLGLQCRYSIGSVAVWLRTDGIQTIPSGQWKTMTTVGPSNYYRIFIPSGTWNFRVSVSGCKPLYRASNESATQPCIRGLSMRGRVLPIFNHTHGSSIVNLTASGTHDFTELSPYEDSYYYLLIVTDGVTNFNVRVTTSECPIKMTMGNSSSGENSSRAAKKSLADEEEKTMIIPDDPCVRRFQLVRVKQLQTFSGLYLFQQGSQWLTPWITLADSSPIIAQFDVLPLIDIGGTLALMIHLETERPTGKAPITIKACLRRARTPERTNGDVVCRNEKMTLNVSSEVKGDSSLLIPYPQPGTWYIAVQAECAGNGISARCENMEISMSIDVRMRQCVFDPPNSCGHHGICREIHNGLLHYTACDCFGGYRGWGCTDSTSVDPRVFSLLSSLLLTFSNAFFIPAIYIAIKRDLYVEALVYSATMLFSSLYHACDRRFMTHCVARYEVLQYCDFFSSILAFWVTLVAIARLPRQFSPIFHMIGVFIVAFGVAEDRTGLPSVLVPLAIGATIPAVSYARRYCRSRQFQRPKGLWRLSAGLGLAAFGLVVFVSVETESNYDYVHSVWHALIALSLVFLLPDARSRKTSFGDEAPTSSDNELADYKEPTTGSAVFTIISSDERLTSGVS